MMSYVYATLIYDVWADITRGQPSVHSSDSQSHLWDGSDMHQRMTAVRSRNTDGFSTTHLRR